MRYFPLSAALVACACPPEPGGGAGQIAEQAVRSAFDECRLVNSIGMELVRIQAPRSDLAMTFYLGVTEVTQAQWRAVMGSEPAGIVRGDDLPATRVTWQEAVLFCVKLSMRENTDVYLRAARPKYA